MFKLSNDLLVIDLEATAGVDDNGVQTNNYIIDIGAVFIDRELNIISTFDSLVRPEEPISEFITELTKIDNKMVEKVGLFPEIEEKFMEWVNKCLNGRSLKKVRLCAWGTYFDIPLLRSVYNKYKINFPFSGTAFDIKTMAMLWYSLSGKSTEKLQVSTVAKTMDLKTIGNFHRAITDAKVEAEILKRVFNDLQGIFIDGKNGVELFTINKS